MDEKKYEEETMNNEQSKRENAKEFFDRVKKGKILEDAVKITTAKAIDDDIFANRTYETLQFLRNAAIKKYQQEEREIMLEKLKKELQSFETKQQEVKEEYKKNKPADKKVLDSKIEQCKNLAMHDVELLNQEIAIYKDNVRKQENNKNKFSDNLIKAREKLEQYQKEFEVAKNNIQLDREKFIEIRTNKENAEHEIFAYEKCIQLVEIEIESANKQIEGFEKRKNNRIEEYKQEIQELIKDFNAKYGEPTKINGRMLANVTHTDIYKQLEKRINSIKETIKNLEKNPEETYNELLEMIKNNESVEKVEEKVYELTYILDKQNIKGVYPWLEKKHSSNLKDLDKLYEIKKTLSKKLAGENGNDLVYYFNQKEFIEDKETLTEYQQEIQRNKDKLEELKEELKYSLEKKSKRKYQQKLKQLEREINKKELEKTITNNEAETTILDKIVNMLKEQKQIVEDKIKHLDNLPQTRMEYIIQKEIENLSIVILEQETETKIISERPKKEYYDIEAREADMKELKNIENLIKYGEEDKEFKENHTREQLIKLFLDEYKDLLKNGPTEEKIETQEENNNEELEIIEEYNEPSKKITERIRSTSFKDKMINWLEKHLSKKTAEKVQEEEIQKIEEKPAKKQQEEEKIKEEPIEKKYISNTAPQPGKFYITVDSQTIEIPMSEAEKYFDEGYEVLACIRSENGNLEFTQIYFTGKENNEDKKK